MVQATDITLIIMTNSIVKTPVLKKLKTQIGSIDAIIVTINVRPNTSRVYLQRESPIKGRIISNCMIKDEKVTNN